MSRSQSPIDETEISDKIDQCVESIEVANQEARDFYEKLTQDYYENRTIGRRRVLEFLLAQIEDLDTSIVEIGNDYIDDAAFLRIEKAIRLTNKEVATLDAAQYEDLDETYLTEVIEFLEAHERKVVSILVDLVEIEDLQEPSMKSSPKNLEKIRSIIIDCDEKIDEVKADEDYKMRAKLISGKLSEFWEEFQEVEFYNEKRFLRQLHEIGRDFQGLYLEIIQDEKDGRVLSAKSFNFGFQILLLDLAIRLSEVEKDTIFEEEIYPALAQNKELKIQLDESQSELEASRSDYEVLKEQFDGLLNAMQSMTMERKAKLDEVEREMEDVDLDLSGFGAEDSEAEAEDFQQEGEGVLSQQETSPQSQQENGVDALGQELEANALSSSPASPEAKTVISRSSSEESLWL